MANKNNGNMFILGGVNNWIAPQYDSSVVFKPEYNYLLMSFEDGIRGYMQNIRFGNSYYIGNLEVRIPVAKILFNYETKSNILNNLQILGFYDFANAWNIDQIHGLANLSKITSYGAGIRSNLLNYFVKLDLAWPQNTIYRNKTPMLIWSLGQDF